MPQSYVRSHFRKGRPVTGHVRAYRRGLDAISRPRGDEWEVRLYEDGKVQDVVRVPTLRQVVHVESEWVKFKMIPALSI